MKGVLIGAALLAATALGAEARELSKKERTIVETAVKSSLKDPASATFKWLPLLPSADPAQPYCGLVNAKNSYGGYVGDAPFLVMVVTEGGDKILHAVVIGMATGDPTDTDSQVTRSFCTDYGYGDFHLAK